MQFPEHQKHHSFTNADGKMTQEQQGSALMAWSKVLDRKRFADDIATIVSVPRGALALMIIKILSDNNWFKKNIYIRDDNGVAIRKYKTMIDGANTLQQQEGGELDHFGKGSDTYIRPGHGRIRRYHLDELPQLVQWAIGIIGGKPTWRAQIVLSRIADALGTTFGFSLTNNPKDLIFSVLKPFGIRPWDNRNREQYDAAFPNEEPLYPFAHRMRKGMVGAHYLFNGTFRYCINGQEAVLNYLDILNAYNTMDDNTTATVKWYKVQRKDNQTYILLPDALDKNKYYEVEVDVDMWKCISLKRRSENIYRDLVKKYGESVADCIGIVEVCINKLVRGHRSS